jgi:hypothetical protein
MTILAPILQEHAKAGAKNVIRMSATVGTPSVLAVSKKSLLGRCRVFILFGTKTTDGGPFLIR